MPIANAETLTPEQIAAIPLHPVESSNIAAIGYSSDLALMLVEFKAGSVYAYFNVAAETSAEMYLAESVGTFFGAHIKKQPERFPFKQIRAARSKAAV